MYGHLESVQIPGAVDEDGDPITSVVFEQDGEPESEVNQKVDEAVNLLLAAYSETEGKDRHIDKEAWIGWLIKHEKVKNRKAALTWLGDERDYRPMGLYKSRGILTDEQGGWHIQETPETRLPLGFLESRK